MGWLSRLSFAQALRWAGRWRHGVHRRVTTLRSEVGHALRRGARQVTFQSVVVGRWEFWALAADSGWSRATALVATLKASRCTGEATAVVATRRGVWRSSSRNGLSERNSV